MTDHDGVKIRKIIYNKKGFQHGVLMPQYPGTLDEAFAEYSKIWFDDHTDKDGDLFEHIEEKDANYVEEFTFKEEDHFYIGIPNTYAFEGITEQYEGYPGCELDKYGFEKMLDIEGREIPYYDDGLEKE